MSETREYLGMFARFPWALRRFLERPLTLQVARQIVQQRMEQRAESFLQIAARSIYGHPTSPYLALLQHAGCEFGDLQALVKARGLEGALHDLREAGVYVTFEEFKGRRPIERNGQTIAVTARDFDNPYARRDLTLQTGGSTGLATAVRQDLDHIAAGAPNTLLGFDAWGMLDVPTIFWHNILPGAGLRFALQWAHCGQHIDRWYSSVGWRDSKYWRRYTPATLFMVLWMQALGARTPMPRIARVDRALDIARQVRRMLDDEGRCLLHLSASAALRICTAAGEAGLDLTGATARVGGEPVTPAKLEAMERVGLRCMPCYGTIETGTIGFACLNPIVSDDMHLMHDVFALITHPQEVPASGQTVQAFNLTSLLDSVPKVMLNYQIDDHGVLEERHCGCPLETLGYGWHVHSVRSYGKLVGESVTLVGNEILAVLEEVLPARFGGSAVDYQLVEEEDQAGFTRLYLVIDPAVNISDERAVVETMLQALRASSAAADAARIIWQKADTIRVRRERPTTSSSGKLLPLHVKRVPRHP